MKPRDCKYYFNTLSRFCKPLGVIWQNRNVALFREKPRSRIMRRFDCKVYFLTATENISRLCYIYLTFAKGHNKGIEKKRNFMNKFLSYVVDFYRCVMRLAACGNKVNVSGKTYKLTGGYPGSVTSDFQQEQYLVFNEDGTVTREYFDARIFEDKNVITHKGTYEQGKKGVTVRWTLICAASANTVDVYEFNADGNITHREEIHVQEGVLQNKRVTPVFSEVKEG